MSSIQKKRLLIDTMKRAAFDLISRSVGACDVNSTVVVSGSPRSGTTWLAEILRGLPDYKLINEPLRLSTNSRARDAGFEWRTHLSPGAVAPEKESYLRDVLNGHVELGPAWHFRSNNLPGKLREHVSRNRAVVKFCRLGRMLHWMADRFDVRSTVVIIRHPCAVIASRLQMGENWKGRNEEKKELPISRRYGGKIPDRTCSEFAHVFESAELWVEHLAIGWALDHYFALHEHSCRTKDYPWILTSYERLLAEGQNELRRIISALGGEVSDEMRSQMVEASAFAANDFQADVQHQLTKWQSELTTKQIDAILQVAEAFRLDFYTAEPTPDYHELYQFQRSSLPC